LILDCLESAGKRHITAEEIVDILKSGGTPVAKSTVYRFLASLEENGDVRKYILAEGNPACYQFIDKHGSCTEHYHLMCKNCGRIFHFESPELQRIFADMRSSQTGEGFVIDGCRTVFYGTCGACAALGENPI
jgi:Fur family ferric uptake transcriptional regulator